MLSEEELKIQIGKRIRYYRKSLQWTLKILSKKCGLSISFISDIESGRTFPSIYSLLKICNSMGVKYSDIIGNV